MFSVFLLIVLVILANKIVRFQLSLVLKVLLVFSVSAISAREENDSPALDFIFSAIIRSILMTLFSLGPPNSGVHDISVWAAESTVYVSYRQFCKCSDLNCTPGILTFQDQLIPQSFSGRTSAIYIQSSPFFSNTSFPRLSSVWCMGASTSSSRNIGLWGTTEWPKIWSGQGEPPWCWWPYPSCIACAGSRSTFSTFSVICGETCLR